MSATGDDDDDDDDKPGRERRKIEIKFIQDKVASSHYLLQAEGWHHEEGTYQSRWPRRLRLADAVLDQASKC